MKFEELKLDEEVLKGIQNAGFEECTGVQETACPVALSGKDIMVQSQTGSGKTAVFIISFLEKFLKDRKEGKHSSCIIISPTRELAQQIADDATVLCSGVEGFHIGVFYGGVGYETQKKRLEMGCDIYVGTPGRVLDFMKRGDLKCDRIDTVVIDEADRLFDMGFYEDITAIFSHLPPVEKRQTLLFSATLDTKVRNIAWKFMNTPEEIELTPEDITVDNIVQEIYHTASIDKFQLLLQILKKESAEAALIFSNSKVRAVEVSNRLKLNGYNSSYLMGSMPQKMRQRTLNDMKTKKIKFLVATDVAARGLQIDDLPLVINYDIPEDFENYVHRIGRTARAGKSGKAITFGCEEYVYGLEAIETYIKMKIPVLWMEDPKTEDKSIGCDWGVKSVFPPKNRGNSRYGSNTGRDRKPYSKTYEKRSYEKKPYEKKPYEKKPYEKKPYEKKPYEKKPYEKKPYEKKPYEKKEYNHEKPGMTSRPPQKMRYSNTNYAKLGSMTQEQRMNYYKKQFGEDFKTSAKKTGPKKSYNKNTVKKDIKNYVKNDKIDLKKVQKPLPVNEKKTEVKKTAEKKGLFSKLFGKKK